MSFRGILTGFSQAALGCLSEYSLLESRISAGAGGEGREARGVGCARAGRVRVVRARWVALGVGCAGARVRAARVVCARSAERGAKARGRERVERVGWARACACAVRVHELGGAVYVRGLGRARARACARVHRQRRANELEKKGGWRGAGGCWGAARA